jgi:hypothetical protein
MTKHRKVRRTRRSQKGGEYQDPNAQSSSWFSEITGFFSDVGDKTKDLLNTGNTMVGNATTAVVDTTKSGLSALNPFSSQDSPTIAPVSTNAEPNMAMNANQVNTTGVVSTGSMGGNRKRRARSMKGGKGGLGLTYYAAPVSGLNVAEPTYWINSNTNQPKVGGSRRRKSRGRKSRRTRRHKRH